MVKHVDGFKGLERGVQRKKLVDKLATSIFGERVSCPDSYEPYTNIIVHEDTTGMAVVINPVSLWITLYKKADYKDCLKLAQRLEKTFKTQVTLETKYDLSK